MPSQDLVKAFLFQIKRVVRRRAIFEIIATLASTISFACLAGEVYKKAEKQEASIGSVGSSGIPCLAIPSDFHGHFQPVKPRHNHTINSKSGDKGINLFVVDQAFGILLGQTIRSAL